MQSETEKESTSSEDSEGSANYFSSEGISPEVKSKVDGQISRIPDKFLNQFGFINYNQYGGKPWTSEDEEKGDVFLTRLYTSVTFLLGIDCEMVGVGFQQKNALGRVSIVNEFGFCIYDTFVKPLKRVSDYRTRHSGIRAEDLFNAPDLKDVISIVAAIVKGKILVGHSIHHDLCVLNLNSHPKELIRDTELYFQKLLKTERKPALRDLSSCYLRVYIQKGEHSSIEDAQAALKLYLIKRNEWEGDTIQMLLKSKVLKCGHHQELTEGQWKNKSGVKCVTVIDHVTPCGHMHKILCSRRSRFVCPHSHEVHLPCGHTQTALCCEDIDKIKCRTISGRNIFPCGHQIPIFCYLDPSEMTCTANVLKSLPCGHNQMALCGENLENVVCRKIGHVIGPCGHVQPFTCGQSPSDILCRFLVTKDLPCGHKKNVECQQSVTSVRCKLKVVKTLLCGHEREVRCHRSLLNIKCKVQSTKTLRCGHQRKVYCHSANSTSIVVAKTLPCRHRQVEFDCKEPISNLCRIMTESLLPCGHVHKYPCYFRDEAKCSDYVMQSLPCDHTQVITGDQIAEEVKCTYLVPSKYNINVWIECYKTKNEEDTCLLPCNEQLHCGHKCRSAFCHDNKDLKHWKCIEKCQRKCNYGHVCVGDHRCYTKCPLTTVSSRKKRGFKCGHTCRVAKCCRLDYLCPNCRKWSNETDLKKKLHTVP